MIPDFAKTTFKKAIAFLQQKISLSTDSWRDITEEEHDAFFVVAGLKGALLADVKLAVERAIANGTDIEEFRRDFAKVTDKWHVPGKDWRARIIFGTNLRQAYADGRYQHQLDPEVRKIQPYLQYLHSHALNFRPHHRALHRQVFKAEEMPIYPPSGFGCRCRAISLTQRQLEERGLQLSTLKRGDRIQYQDSQGLTQSVAIAPDEGFAADPRILRQERRRRWMNELSQKLPRTIGGQMMRAIAQQEEEWSKSKSRSRISDQ